MDNIAIAEQLVEKIIPFHLPFIVWESETDESGNFTKLYSSKSEELYKDILKLLENEQ